MKNERRTHQKNRGKHYSGRQHYVQEDKKKFRYIPNEDDLSKNNSLDINSPKEAFGQIEMQPSKEYPIS